MTKQDFYNETEQAMDAAQKLTWYGFILTLLGF